MRKYLIALFCLTILAGCWGNTSSVTTDKTSTGSQTENTLINNSWSTMTNDGIVHTGSKISVDYTGTLDDGTVFDATSKHEWTPLTFTVGTDPMIPGFTAGVVWMKVGETKKIKIPAKDAYGEYDPKKKEVVDKSKLKDFTDHGFKLEKWEKIPTQFGSINIVASDAKTATLDLNHELAWKDLTFEITLKEIK